MKNILFIGPYRQNDGWGDAALSYIRALQHTSHNITIRPIYMGHNFRQDDDLSQDILDLEQNIQSKYDIVIQNCLPGFTSYIPGVYNIGLFFIENKSVNLSSWGSKINQLDEVWVCSEFEKKNLEEDGVKPKVRCIPMPIDIEKYEEDYEELDEPVLYDRFAFYFIGKYTQRKNVHSLLIAFHREFHVNEGVELIIKTDFEMDGVKQRISNDIKQIKDLLRLHKDHKHYKPVQFITTRVDEKHICSLHKKCHCFVMPSSGEACCTPALDAMGFCNPCIVNKNTGMSQFVNDGNGWLVDSHETPLFIKDPPIHEVYDGHNTWYEIDILDLQRKMRLAFSQWNTYPFRHKQEYAFETVFDHSYKHIGEKIEQVLGI